MYTQHNKYTTYTLGCVFLVLLCIPNAVFADECSCIATFSRVNIEGGSVREGIPGTRVTTCTRSETFSQPKDTGLHFRTLYSIIDTWWNNTTAAVSCRAEEPIYTGTFLGFPNQDAEITLTSCPSLRYASETPIRSNSRDLQTYEISCNVKSSPDPVVPVQGNQDPIIQNDYVGIPFAIPSTESIRITKARSLPELIGKGLRLFTGFFGSIALLMVIYGGLQIMTAAGQSEKIKQGGKIIAWASIGLITMMLSYLLVSFVFGAIA